MARKERKTWDTDDPVDNKDWRKLFCKQFKPFKEYTKFLRNNAAWLHVHLDPNMVVISVDPLRQRKEATRQHRVTSVEEVDRLSGRNVLIAISKDLPDFFKDDIFLAAVSRNYSYKED